MKPTQMLISNRITRALILAASFSSLVVFPYLIFSPISAKYYSINLSAFVLFGFLTSYFRTNVNKKFMLGKMAIALTICFLFIFFVRAATSPNFNQAFFGVLGRQSGFLIYFSYGVFFIIATLHFTSNNLNFLINTFMYTGAIACIFQVLEYFGTSPLNFESSYLGVSGVFGNPNFSGSFMALVSVTAFWKLKYSATKQAKMFPLLLLLTGLFGVFVSRAWQGWLSILAGTSLVIFLDLYRNKKKISYLFFVIVAITASFIVMGILQKGPLGSILYKNSVSERGDMWRAAWRMITQNPLLGVGIERFGSNFRLYRDEIQILRAGPDITTDNSHNIYLHLASTGGVFLAALFILLQFLVIFSAVRCLKSSNIQIRNEVSLIFSLWLMIQLQNFISVDNAGVYIWNWICGGAIVALGIQVSGDKVQLKLKHSEHGYTKKKKSTVGFSTHSKISGALLLAVGLFLFIPKMVAHHEIATTFYVLVQPDSKLEIDIKEKMFLNAEKRDLSNNEWPRLAANSFFENGAWSATIKASERAIALDPTDWVSWWYMATAYERLGDFENAIHARKKTTALDPLNTAILLELAKDQKAVGDLVGLASTKAKVLAINPGAPEISALNSL